MQRPLGCGVDGEMKVGNGACQFTRLRKVVVNE
jgi:hypothetical protein